LTFFQGNTAEEPRFLHRLEELFVQKNDRYETHFHKVLIGPTHHLIDEQLTCSFPSRRLQREWLLCCFLDPRWLWKSVFLTYDWERVCAQIDQGWRALQYIHFPRSFQLYRAQWSRHI